jgi:hypothetical protein
MLRPLRLNPLNLQHQLQESLVRKYLEGRDKYQHLISQADFHLTMADESISEAERQSAMAKFRQAKAVADAQLTEYSKYFDALTPETKQKYLSARIPKLRNPGKFQGAGEQLYKVYYRVRYHGRLPEWLSEKIWAASPDDARAFVREQEGWSLMSDPIEVESVG